MDMKEKKELLNDEWKLDKDDDRDIDFEDVEMDDDDTDKKDVNE